MTTPNSIVYNRRGERARYVIHSPQGHIVMPEVCIIDGEGNDLYDYADVVVWDEVLTTPPRAVLDEQIAGLNETVTTLRNEISTLRQERLATDADIKARRARIAQHEQLATLDTVLTKGVTHYVKESYGGVVLVTLDETKSEYNSQYFKLLTLYGDSKGNLAWSLESHYHSASGMNDKIWPCTSHAEAVAKRLERFEVMWNEWRTGKKPSYFDYYTASAIKQGIELPADVAAEIKTRAIATKRYVFEQSEKTYLESRAALEAAMAT